MKLTIILLCHFCSGRLLSGPSSDLDQLLDDFFCGNSAIYGQKGILQSLQTNVCKSQAM